MNYMPVLQYLFIKWCIMWVRCNKGIAFASLASLAWISVFLLGSFRAAYAEDSVDQALRESGLGEIVGRDVVKDIIEKDTTYNDTALKLVQALRIALDPLPSLPAPATEANEKAAIDKLKAAIEAGLKNTLKPLPPNPARNKSWLDALKALEVKLDEGEKAFKVGERLAARVKGYQGAQVNLTKLADFKQKKNTAPPPDNIIPEKFWDVRGETFEVSGLYKFDVRPIESTSALAKMMLEVATLPETTSAQELLLAFEKGKRTFLDMIERTRSIKQYEGWDNFLIYFDNALKTAEKEGRYDPTIPAYIRAVLKQSAAALETLGKEADSGHDVAGNTGQLAGAAQGGGASGLGVTGGGTSHAAVHHARAMHHIQLRHERRMYRIERIGAR